MFHKIRWTVGGERLHKYQIWYKREDGVPYHTCGVGWCRRLFALYRRTGGGILSSFISDNSLAYVRKLLFLLSVCYERGFGLGNKSQVLIRALPLDKMSGMPYCMNSYPICLLRWLVGKRGSWTQFVGCDPSYRKSFFFFFLIKPGYSVTFPIKQGVTFELLCCIRAASGPQRTKTHVDWSIYSGFAREWTNLGIFLFICLTSQWVRGAGRLTIRLMKGVVVESYKEN